MQGQYLGLRSFVQSENPRAIYVWCFAHLLSLVIVDTLDSSTDTKVFFVTYKNLSTLCMSEKEQQFFMIVKKS